MYNYQAGSVIISTGASSAGNTNQTVYERMRITPNGNVGIGTTNPLLTLHVLGKTLLQSTDDGTALRVATVGTTNNAGIEIMTGRARGTNAETYIDFTADATDFTSKYGTPDSGARILVHHNSSWSSMLLTVLEPGGNAFTKGVEVSYDRFNATTDNIFALGVPLLRWTAVYAVNGTIQTSHSSQKNYEPIPYGLHELMRITPIIYSWKTQEALPDDHVEKNYKYYGVLADEVDKILPELCYTETDKYQLNYSELIPVIIKSVQELNDIVKALKLEVADLKAQLAQTTT